MKGAQLEKFGFILSLLAILTSVALMALNIDPGRYISLLIQALIFLPPLLGFKKQNADYKAWKEKWRNASPEELATRKKEQRWILLSMLCLISTGILLIGITALVG
jgi:hypothetical protein